MKSTSSGYFSELVDSFGRSWNRFWFTPSDPLMCSVLRIAVGLLVIAHLLTLTDQLDRWYARDGLLPPASVRTLVVAGTGGEFYRYSYLNYLGPTETRVAHALALVAAAAFAAGLLTRVSGFVTLVALLAYIHRLPLLAGHAEHVLVFLVAYLCIGPADAYFSASRWLTARRNSPPDGVGITPSFWATLSLRMIQVHLAAFVAMMGLTKLNGDAWWIGEAIWNLLAQTHSRPLDLTFLRNYVLAINFWTLSVVYFELAFPVLVWNRLARPILLVIGAVIWLSLALATGLALFSLTLVVATLAFVPAESCRAILRRSTAAAPALAR